MRIARTLAALACLVPFLAPRTTASTLLLDGQTDIVRSVGDPFVLSISGTPGMPQLLLFDLSPGPTQLYGQSLPLGFSPYVTVLNLGLVPGGGTLALPVVTPAIPGLDALTVHLLAVISDPAAPFGLDFSNGASLSIVTPPAVVPSRATLVGRKVTMFSSGLTTGAGVLKPGVSVSWNLQQAPPGSTAAIAHSDQAFATITPDLPGEYLMTANIVKNGIAYPLDTRLRAYRITYPVLANGSILPSNSSFTIGIEGPSGFTLEVDGVPSLPGPGGSFGPFSLDFSVIEFLKSLPVTIRDIDGNEVREIAKFFFGQAVSFGSGAVKSLLARLNESGLDLAGDVIEAQLQTMDLKSAIVALPAVELVDQPGPLGGTLFSAYADVTNVTYDLPIGFSQNATASGFATTLTMQDLKVTVKVTGEISNIPYSVTGTASADPAVFTGNATLGPNGATLNANFSGHSVNLQNFSLALGGFPGTSTQLSTITSTLKTYLANQIRNFLASNIANKLKSMFGSLLPDFAFVPSPGVDLDLGSTFSVVSHTSGGVSFQLNSVCLAPSPKPGAPALTQFLANVTTPPSLPSTGPGGIPFDYAFSTADDYYNSVLAAATRAGFLDGPADILLAGSGTTISLTAGQLAAAFPGAGFEDFAPETGVLVVYHATSGPVARPTAGGMKLGVRSVGVEVEFRVVTAYAEVPLLRIALDSDLEFELGVDPDGTLDVKSVVGDAVHTVIDGVESVVPSDPEELSDLIDECAKGLKSTIPALLEQLRPPSFAQLGALLSGVANSALGTAQEYWAQFCAFLPAN